MTTQLSVDLAAFRTRLQALGTHLLTLTEADAARLITSLEEILITLHDLATAAKMITDYLATQTAPATKETPTDGTTTA